MHVGNMMEEALVREGYGVWRAYSGTEALLVLERAKPFHIRELLARIAVQLRNTKETSDNPVLTFDAIALNMDLHIVTVDAAEVRLTRTEYAILKMLMQNPAQVITKSQLLDRISADTPDCTESSLKVHMSNLRKKLRNAGGTDYIEAVWGIGFRLRTE